MNRPTSYEPKVVTDDRGVFVPAIQHENILAPIKRIYHIYNYGKGVIRGFHFHKKEWKMFTIVNGSAKFVCVSMDGQEIIEFVSSGRKPIVIVVPPGWYNGWKSLEDETILLCASTSSFEESKDDDARVDPFSFGQVWQVKPR